MVCDKAIPFWGWLFYLVKKLKNLYLIEMINLQQGATQFIYLTLTEKQTLTSPNYLFRFVNRTSNDEVTFVLLFADDTSIFKDRYNKFSIKTDKYFSLNQAGEYRYFVYEQASAYNKDYTKATKLLEEGIMILEKSEAFEYTEHKVDNTYIVK